jgi:hypothetical protein
VHNVADGAAPLSNDSVYADRAWKPANLRQYSINRAGHCIFTASEEITAFQTLFHRIDRGQWPATDPATLNAAARTHGPEFQQILNLLTDEYVLGQPAFTPHKPGRFPRRS